MIFIHSTEFSLPTDLSVCNCKIFLAYLLKIESIVLGGIMKQLSLIVLFVTFSFTDSIFGRVIKNTEFSDLYLYNCSSKNDVNICYPERENNPGEQIRAAIEQGIDLEWTSICEEMHQGDLQDIALCVSTMRGESDFAACDILWPEMGEMNDHCKMMAITSTSLSESIDEDLLRCELDYQEALISEFSGEFPGINISFVSESDEIELIHNASVESAYGYSNDILLLPEHENKAFCNEDAQFSVSDLEKRAEAAKG